MQRLAETMNQMLDRLESAARHQRDFVADASHDLQSPLTVIRTELEVAAAHPDATDWPQSLQTLRVEADRMERLVRDLLFLARADATPPATPGLVDLDDVVLEEVARVRATTRLGSTPAPCPRRRCAAPATTWPGWSATCWPTRAPTPRRGSS